VTGKKTACAPKGMQAAVAVVDQESGCSLLQADII
jgi:hypothetical protein